MSATPTKAGSRDGCDCDTGVTEGTRPRTRHSRASQGDMDKHLSSAAVSDEAMPVSTSEISPEENADDSNVMNKNTDADESSAADVKALDDSKVLEAGSSVSESAHTDPEDSREVPEPEPEGRVDEVEKEKNLEPPQLKPEEASSQPTKELPGPSTVKLPRISPTGGEPKVIKLGDQVITSYVDEKTGKIAVYEPGIKLEVSDFAGKWYPAKVVEVDPVENEILVHFEHWSSRFDEWIKMDSNRLRPSPNTNIVKTQFKVGEHVEALWNTDGQRYPGVIQNVLPNDYYQVLFDDGIKLKKKSNQIFKLKPLTRNISRSSTSTAPTMNPKLMRPLPELTPISHLISSSANKPQLSPGSGPTHPPPLIPRPPKLKSMKLPPKASTITLAPEGSSSSDVVSPPPPLAPQSEPLPYTNVFAQIDTDLGKRKRTVQNYSALLKTSIRPEVSDSTPPLPKRKYTRRGMKLDSSIHPPPSPDIISNELPDLPNASISVAKQSSTSLTKLKPQSFSTKKLRTIVVSEESPLASKAIVKQAQLEEVPADGQTKVTEAAGESVVPPTPGDATSSAEVPAKRYRKATEKALALMASTAEEEDPPVRRIQRRRTLTRKSFEIPEVVKNRRGRWKRSFSPSKTQIDLDQAKPDESEDVTNSGQTAAVAQPTSPVKISHEESSDMTSDLPVPETQEASISVTENPQINSGVDAAATSSTGPEEMEMDSAEAATKSDSTKSDPVASGQSLQRPRRSTNRPGFKISTSKGSSESTSTPGGESQHQLPVDATTPATPTSASLLPAPSPSPAPPTPAETPGSEDAPLAKRKRTIHDYSMLLKTRPKFFFDIDEEIQRPNRQTCTKRSRNRKSLETELAQAGPSSQPGSESVAEKVDLDSGGIVKKQSSVDDSKVEDAKTLPSRSRRPSQSVASKTGLMPTEEIQVIATRTSETNDINGASIILPVSTTSTLKLHSIASTSQSRVSKEQRVDPKPKLPLLGSSLSGIECPASDEEELLDIDIDYTSQAPPVLPVVKPKTPDLQPTVRIPKMTMPKPLSASRRPRPSNKWWKRKSPAALALQRSRSLAASRRARVRAPSPERPRQPGDVLSGLSSGRIRQIRKAIHDTGVKKFVEGKPAFKDVSVDIIDCYCGKTDEHGLMIQCESCLRWQHGQCYTIETVKDMPPHYVCEFCQMPEDVRESRRKEWTYEFHKAGWLPGFTYAERMSPETGRLLETTNELMARIFEAREIIHSTRINLHIMQAKPDHKKLYQWDKPHKTIREHAQNERFTKVFRPLLKRLLYVNRKDPKYVEKLKAKVQTAQRLGWRRNWTTGMPKPTNAPQTSQKSNSDKPSEKKQVFNVDELDDDDIECVDLTEDSETHDVKIKEEPVKVEITEKLEDVERVVCEVLSEIVSSVASDSSSTEDPSICKEDSVPCPTDRPSVIHQIGAVASSPPESSTDVKKELETDAPIINASDPLKELMASSADLDLNNPDVLMDFDPSDPRFTTMAEDLVKSCCEEPEGFIKTLEDLAKENENETVSNMGTSDNDLMNLLDDDFMHSLDPAFDIKSFDDLKSGPSFPVAQPPVFKAPAPPPPTLTRITPELCRENLTLTILDQQKVIDDQLNEIETKVAELAELRKNGLDTSSQLKRIVRIQRKARRAMRSVQILQKYGQEKLMRLVTARRKRKAARRAAKRLALGLPPDSETEDLSDSETESGDEEYQSDEYYSEEEGIQDGEYFEDDTTDDSDSERTTESEEEEPETESDSSTTSDSDDDDDLDEEEDGDENYEDDYYDEDEEYEDYDGNELEVEGEELGEEEEEEGEEREYYDYDEEDEEEYDEEDYDEDYQEGDEYANE